MMPFLFKIARKSAWILVAAMIVALFSGVMLVRYQLFSWISYSLIRDIHVFFILIVLIPVFYLHTLGGIMMLLKRKGLADKKILTASVIIVWTAVFLVFGFVYSYTAPATSGNNTDIKTTGSSSLTLTQAEITQHGSAGSCWVIISGKVYDLTSYIGIHPAGPGGNYSLLWKRRNDSVCNKEFGGSAFIICGFASQFILHRRFRSDSHHDAPPDRDNYSGFSRRIHPPRNIRTRQLQLNSYTGRNSKARFSWQLLGDNQRQSIRSDKLHRHPSCWPGGNYSLLWERRNDGVCNKEFGGSAFIICNFTSQFILHWRFRSDSHHDAKPDRNNNSSSSRKI